MIARLTPCMRWTKSRRSKICVRNSVVSDAISQKITVEVVYRVYVHGIRPTSLKQSSNLKAYYSSLPQTSFQVLTIRKWSTCTSI